MVGDDPVAQLTDLKSGKQVLPLKGHWDYSFAAAWHPDGHLLATGNQVWALVIVQVCFMLTSSHQATTSKQQEQQASIAADGLLFRGGVAP